MDRVLVAAAWLFSCVIAVVPALPADGQVFAPGPASAAVGRGGPAYVYGSEALFLNPANIALETRGAIEISSGRAIIGAGGNLLQFRFYNEVFTSGETITDEERQRVLSEWFGGADSGHLRSASVVAEAVPVAVIHAHGSGTLAYSMRLRTHASVSINGGWLDLLLSGTEQDRAIPLDGQFGLMSTTELGVTYARKLAPRLALGATTKLVFGNDFTDARLESVATITDASVTHDFDYVVRAAGGISSDFVDHVDFFSKDAFGGGGFSPSFLSATGFGMGMDVGGTFPASPEVRLSASLTDVGFIRWSGAAQTIRPSGNSFTFDGLVLDIDRIRDEHDGNVGDYLLSSIDSLASLSYRDVERSRGSFSTALPTTLHLGAAWTPAGTRATVIGGTSAPLFASPVRPAAFPDVHVGAEYEPGGTVRFPLRAGLQLGGSSAMMLSFGFGVHSPRFDFDLGVAATPRSDLMGAGARYTAAVSAITVRI